MTMSAFLRKNGAVAVQRTRPHDVALPPAMVLRSLPCSAAMRRRSARGAGSCLLARSHMTDQRTKPPLRPRRALRPRRRQCRRRGGADRRRAASSASISTAPGTPPELAAALGGLKGPIMKVAQLLATIPEALPPEYITELTKLQSQAPPMGWAFVKRRMQAELGADWQKKFASFEHHPAAAASLGQVHRATLARRRRAGLQAAICRHAVGGRGRPEAAQACCSRSAAGSTRRSTPARSSRRSARGCARSSTTAARPSTSRSIATCSTDEDADPRAASRGRSFRPGGC